MASLRVGRIVEPLGFGLEEISLLLALLRSMSRQTRATKVVSHHPGCRIG
jgi:hypothetical protein